MLMLALDTTTLTCSVALGDGEKLWAEYLLNIKKTHSQRLMPLIVSLLQDSGVRKEQLKGLSVTVGPGSFTGIRIGLATAQGLSQGLGIPVVGVMTLDALAQAAAFFDGLICPILDARKGQVYTALYRGGPDGPVMLKQAAAESLEEFSARLAERSENVIFLGDAIGNFRNNLKSALGERYREAPPSLSLNRASLVLLQGQKIWLEQGPPPPYSLKPFYIRLSEAERRLLERRGGGE